MSKMRMAWEYQTVQPGAVITTWVAPGSTIPISDADNLPDWSILLLGRHPIQKIPGQGWQMGASFYPFVELAVTYGTMDGRTEATIIYLGELDE